MKLLFISNLYAPNVLGGYEVLCAQVAEELAGRGHEVVVLTAGREGGKFGAHPAEEYTHNGVTVIPHLTLEREFGQPLGANRLGRLRNTQINHGCTTEALRLIRPDAVMIWSRLRIGVGVSRAVEEAGIPVFYTFNDRHPLRFRAPTPGSGNASAAGGTVRTMRRRLGAWLDGGVFAASYDRDHRYRDVMSISAALARELSDGGLPVSSDDVLPQAIPLKDFQPKADPGSMAGEPRILAAGQLRADKGFETAIRAAHALVRECTACTLTIAGEGDPGYLKTLKALAASGPATVQFAGRVPHARMPELYRSHHILVFPSEWSEPMGLVHLEAMACGTPVVSTRTGGSAEVIYHEENALAFEPGDAEGLTRALVRLVREPGLATRLAHAARSYVEDRHAFAGWCSAIEDRLESMTRRAAA